MPYGFFCCHGVIDEWLDHLTRRQMKFGRCAPHEIDMDFLFADGGS